MENVGIIVNNLLAAAGELELHAQWLRSIAVMLENRPNDISVENHKYVLILAIESLGKQIALTSTTVDGIGGEL